VRESATQPLMAFALSGAVEIWCLVILHSEAEALVERNIGYLISGAFNIERADNFLQPFNIGQVSVITECPPAGRQALNWIWR